MAASAWRRKVRAAAAHWRQVAIAGKEPDVIEHYEGAVREQPMLRNVASFGQTRALIDEPFEFGGRGTALNPAQILLAALGASLTVTARIYAEEQQLPVTGLNVQVSGDLDVRGFFDTDTTKRAGFTSISALLEIGGAISPEEFQILRKQIIRACPILDTLRERTDLTIRQAQDA